MDIHLSRQTTNIWQKTTHNVVIYECHTLCIKRNLMQHQSYGWTEVTEERVITILLQLYYEVHD